MDRERLIQWSVLAFAAAFFIVGVYRVVEFRAIGWTPVKRRLFTVLHVIGCALFSATLALAVLDPENRKVMFSLFAAALAFLAPGQFTLGMAIKKKASILPSPKPRR